MQTVVPHTMRAFYKILAVLIISFPVIVNSQDCFKQDSIVLEITAVENIDTWAQKEGFYNFQNELHKISYYYYPETNLFKSDFFQKQSCFKTSDYDTIVRHKDDSSRIKGTYVLQKDLIVELIEQITIDKCCDFKFSGDSMYSDSNCCKLTPADYEIDDKWLKQNVNRKEILKRAKELDKKWEFGNQYSMREDRLIAYKGYSNLDSLSLFLIDFQRPLTLYTSHVSQSLWIDLISGGDTIISLQKIINPMKQQSPWINTDKEIYNPKINLIVTSILPKRFLFKDLIKREYIKESYIDWILNRWD